MSVRLGELLTKASLITQDQLKEALRVQKETGGKLGETLIKLGFVAEEDITECLSQQFGVPSINLQHFEIDPGVIKLISSEVARKYNILPVNKTGATITIAMADPTNVFAMDDIKFMTGYN
ncbi:MAG TPA: type II secretion system protein GspE, partial [Thermoanaerobaculia bacterium]